MLADILAKIALHYSRAKAASEEIVHWQKLDTAVFKDFERIKSIDTFIYRFTKMQDMMGDKLFRVFLDAIGEYRENMSLLDVLDRLEKLEILDDATRWMTYRKLRNHLTHEYPTNEEEIVQGITLALEAFSYMTTLFESIDTYAKKHGLLST